MSRIRNILVIIILSACFGGGLLAAAQQSEPKPTDLTREVRHQLLLLPYYSVFDNLGFRIEGSKVVLVGQVVRPALKSDSEAAG